MRACACVYNIEDNAAFINNAFPTQSRTTRLVCATVCVCVKKIAGFFSLLFFILFEKKLKVNNYIYCAGEVLNIIIIIPNIRLPGTEGYCCLKW